MDLIYIDPPFNSNRNYEVFWGESKENWSFDDRHESTQAYIDSMRPRCQQLARVLKPTGRAIVIENPTLSECQENGLCSISTSATI